MSVSTATRLPSLIKPIATPAHDALTGTPASNSASDPPHTVAMEDEPFDSRMSDTMRTVRSEERRVGKECRCRWSPEHEEEKKRKKDDWVERTKCELDK